MCSRAQAVNARPLARAPRRGCVRGDDDEIEAFGDVRTHPELHVLLDLHGLHVEADEAIIHHLAGDPARDTDRLSWGDLVCRGWLQVEGDLVSGLLVNGRDRYR